MRDLCARRHSEHQVFRWLGPGVAMLLGAVILIWFPLRGGYLAQVQEQVLALHAKKHEELEP